MEGQRKVAEVDLGPVRYLATRWVPTPTLPYGGSCLSWRF